MEVSGTERAFLVSARKGGPAGRAYEIRSALSARPDRSRLPSSRVLREALGRRRPFALLDVQSDGDLGSRGSVRSLELRSIFSVPVPVSLSLEAALVLDSRFRAELDPAQALASLEGHAGLLALLCGLEDRPAKSEPPREARGGAVKLVGRSRRLLELLELLERAARTRLPVLLVGESGTGKELLARWIHEASDRRHGPFLAVNCAAVPESLLESEMFGAVRGAYTGADRDRAGLFQLAHGGTLLLDEIGDMPASLQAKLLRVLEDGRVRPLGGRADVLADVRIVAATNRDLAGLVAAGRFRGDLYYRLAVVRADVPPLRERLEDLPLLAEHLLDKLRRAHGLPAGRLSPGALGRLAAHPWPGNVRELEATLARALLRTRTGDILEDDLEFGTEPPRIPPPEQRPLERAMIETALREAGGVVARAAARIGWSRQKLQRRMAALGVQRPGGRTGETSSDSSTFQ
jgi:DNA-binding NtrC family response regulator